MLIMPVEIMKYQMREEDPGGKRRDLKTDCRKYNLKEFKINH